MGEVADLEPSVFVRLPGWPLIDRPASRRMRSVIDSRASRPRVVELFAGVGGFRIGLERSGWEIVWANQWEPGTTVQHAFACYAARFGTGEHVCGDLHLVLDEVDAGIRSIPDHELLVGGFPCQDYSVSKPLNQAHGIVGKKGVLWWQIHRLLTLKRPPYLFLENVDRLLKSPARQRGRDFAVMLATLADLGYEVEWRVVNAADYGFPQKRRRVFIVGRLAGGQPRDPDEVIHRGVIGRALPVRPGRAITPDDSFLIDGHPAEVSEAFGATKGASPFRNAGSMSRRRVWTIDVQADWDGPRQTLGDILEPASEVPQAYFIPPQELPRWQYLKGAKRERRVHKGSETPYFYVEGPIPYPDPTDRPSRTILTGEGGRTPSRFKHLIGTEDGRSRRLTPRELERLNGFPDDWTATGMSDGQRAFMMGNALVVGIVERIGRELMEETRGDRLVRDPWLATTSR
jgi:DNA (cytosine-5)-methyltransferase 1